MTDVAAAGFGMFLIGFSVGWVAAVAAVIWRLEQKENL